MINFVMRSFLLFMFALFVVIANLTECERATAIAVTIFVRVITLKSEIEEEAMNEVI